MYHSSVGRHNNKVSITTVLKSTKVLNTRFYLVNLNCSELECIGSQSTLQASCNDLAASQRNYHSLLRFHWTGYITVLIYVLTKYTFLLNLLLLLLLFLFHLVLCGWYKSNRRWNQNNRKKYSCVIKCLWGYWFSCKHRENKVHGNWTSSRKMNLYSM